MKKTIWTLFAIVLLSGCASTGTNFNQDHVAKIVDGKTTKSQVLEWFGQPNGRNYVSELGEGYTYTYAEAKMNAATFIPFVNIFMGGSTGHSKTLSVYFDETETVVFHSYTNSDTSTKLN